MATDERWHAQLRVRCAEPAEHHRFREHGEFCLRSVRAAHKQHAFGNCDLDGKPGSSCLIRSKRLWLSFRPAI